MSDEEQYSDDDRFLDDDESIDTIFNNISIDLDQPDQKPKQKIKIDTKPSMTLDIDSIPDLKNIMNEYKSQKHKADQEKLKEINKQQAIDKETERKQKLHDLVFDDQYYLTEHIRQQNIKFRESLDRERGKITPKCYCFVGDYFTHNGIIYPTKLNITDLNNRETNLTLYPEIDFDDINYHKLSALALDDNVGFDELDDGEKHVINLPHKTYSVIQIIYDQKELIMKVYGITVMNMNNKFQYYLATIKGLLKSFMIHYK